MQRFIIQPTQLSLKTPILILLPLRVQRFTDSFRLPLHHIPVYLDERVRQPVVIRGRHVVALEQIGSYVVQLGFFVQVELVGPFHHVVVVVCRSVHVPDEDVHHQVAGPFFDAAGVRGFVQGHREGTWHEVFQVRLDLFFVHVVDFLFPC